MVFTRKPINCTLVGDGMVGKTSIVHTYIGKGMDTKYVATVFENYAGGTSIDGERYTVSIYDPAGQHDYSHMRACTYTDCEVILMCYNANDRDTFDNIKSFWLPEIRKFRGKKSSLILVATQTDTRNPNSGSSVSTQEGEDLARDMNAVGYMETTIKNHDSVKDVFQKVVTLFANDIALKHSSKNLFDIKQESLIFLLLDHDTNSQDGSATDTRNQNSDSSVSTQEREDLARKMNAVGYMETTIQNDDSTDTRNPNSGSSVSTQEEDLAREMNAVGYMETTIQNDDSLKDVFQKIVTCALKCQKKNDLGNILFATVKKLSKMIDHKILSNSIPSHWKMNQRNANKPGEYKKETIRITDDHGLQAQNETVGYSSLAYVKVVPQLIYLYQDLIMVNRPKS
ncbi:rho-related protein racD-like [Pecten maximus]|uniref:rho-related protein racD-like n=1 Tax=Pecten maximus TaxID=6579 RepID=UPI00145863CA|nr:rho-related protein racD-like [Pecten maximus]